MLVIATALVVLYAFVTTRTVIGRQIYAVGGNAKAVKLFGIKTERLSTMNGQAPPPRACLLIPYQSRDAVCV
jgi:ABC-type uncharacterized transport system permease subunit